MVCFEMMRLKFEHIQIGNDFFDIGLLGCVEVLDYFVIYVIPFGEIEAFLKGTDSPGEAFGIAGTGTLIFGKVTGKLK